MVSTIDQRAMNQKTWMNGWSVCVGSMDAMTGVLLMVMPAWVVKVLMIPGVSEENLIFLSWIGAFVFGVGASYGLGLVGEDRRIVVWKMTALVRYSVAVFLLIACGMGRLPWQWLVVAVSDAVVASVQLGWLWMNQKQEQRA